MIKDSTLTDFLDALASGGATPGGGAAAAMMGAMGAALVGMMCNLTIGKKAYQAVAGEMQDVLKKSEVLRMDITDMIAADIAAFDRLMAAYGMPKEHDEEKAARSNEIQAALQVATTVPLDCARAASQVVALCRRAAEKGNLNVISDAGVAAVAAEAALKSAALNVYINIDSIKDTAFAEDCRTRLATLLRDTENEAADIYALVKSKLSNP